MKVDLRKKIQKRVRQTITVKDRKTPITITLKILLIVGYNISILTRKILTNYVNKEPEFVGKSSPRCIHINFKRGFVIRIFTNQSLRTY